MLNLIIRILVNYFRLFWQKDVHRLLLRYECAYVCVCGVAGAGRWLSLERGGQEETGLPRGRKLK